MTPYEKLKSLHASEQYLKSELTFELLDRLVMEMNDLEAAQKLSQAQKILFQTVSK